MSLRFRVVCGLVASAALLYLVYVGPSDTTIAGW